MRQEEDELLGAASWRVCSAKAEKVHFYFIIRRTEKRKSGVIANDDQKAAYIILALSAGGAALLQLAYIFILDFFFSKIVLCPGTFR